MNLTIEIAEYQINKAIPKEINMVLTTIEK